MLTLGLEEEYLLVDPTSRELRATPPEQFMQRCQERLGERVTHEFLQAQVEVGTTVCRDVGAARAQLVELRATVAATAREFGMAMIAASTHPFANWRAQKKVEKERYLGWPETCRRWRRAWSSAACTCTPGSRTTSSGST